MNIPFELDNILQYYFRVLEPIKSYEYKKIIKNGVNFANDEIFTNINPKVFYLILDINFRNGEAITKAIDFRINDEFGISRVIQTTSIGTSGVLSRANSPVPILVNRLGAIAATLDVTIVQILCLKIIKE